MIETISVSLSGLQLALQLKENFKAKHGQEGFLLGEIIEKTTRKVTDSDVQQDYVSRTIKIVSCVPCPSLGYFYDGTGRLKVETVQRLLGGSVDKVIAWYKYRPISGIKFSFRERVVHRQLAKFLNINPEHFTCCILVSEYSDNGAVLSFSQNFIRLRDYDYEELPMHIANLGDTNLGYRAPAQPSDTFKRIVRGVKLDKKSFHGSAAITTIQNSLQRHTSKLAKDLVHAENHLFELEQELKELQEQGKNRGINNGQSDGEGPRLENKNVTEKNHSRRCKNPVNRNRKKGSKERTKSVGNDDIDEN